MRTSTLFLAFSAGALCFLSACANSSVSAPPPPSAPRISTADTPSVQPPPPVPSASSPSASASSVQDLLSEALKPIYFDYDKSEIKSAGTEILARIGAALKNDRSLSIVVEGNSDERGSTEYNQALGDRRSHAAVKWLLSYGVRKGQLRSISYGKEKPSNGGHDEAAWALNRRDEFAKSTN